MITRTELKKAMGTFSPKNTTKIQRISTINKRHVILETKQKISEGKYVFSLPCFDIQSATVSFCGKYLISTQTCRNLESLKHFIEYNLNKEK